MAAWPISSGIAGFPNPAGDETLLVNNTIVLQPRRPVKLVQRRKAHSRFPVQKAARDCYNAARLAVAMNSVEGDEE
jgi:hypothetical protein